MAKLSNHELSMGQMSSGKPVDATSRSLSFSPSICRKASSSVQVFDQTPLQSCQPTYFPGVRVWTLAPADYCLLFFANETWTMPSVMSRCPLFWRLFFICTPYTMITMVYYDTTFKLMSFTHELDPAFKPLLEARTRSLSSKEAPDFALRKTARIFWLS